MTAQYAIAGCWTIWLLYWAVSAWFVKPTREVRCARGGLRWIIAAVVLASALARALGWSLPTSEPLLSHGKPSGVNRDRRRGPGRCRIGGRALCAVHVAGNWSAERRVLKENHELITRGIYHYIVATRSTGILLMLLGTILALGSAGSIAVFALALLFIMFRARKEEQLMTEHFPNEYPAYKQRVKALIPYVL